jgi:hypothetical protein
MGCESIVTVMTGIELSASEFCEHLVKHFYVHPVPPFYQKIPLEYNFEYSDTKHIIELQVSDYLNNKRQLSCRFSLCHPPSIDKRFTEFVKSIAKDLVLEIRIRESCQVKGEGDIFHPPEYNGFDEVLKEVIQIKRKYWIADFGEETAVISCQEALKRFVWPKCKRLKEI